MIGELAKGDERDPAVDPVGYRRAVLNILEDFGDERTRLQDTQKAVLNILEDVAEMNEVERLNREMAGEIAGRKRVERALSERAEELARSNQELEQFAYVASHDLQEPLRMVSSYTELLRRRYRGKLDADADEFIAFAVDGAKRMQKMINDLLLYSRVGTQGKPFEPTDCGSVLDQVLRDIQVIIEESGAVVARDPLPVIPADAGQIGQVFQNLLANAIKFRGTNKPRIHISAHLKDPAWVFSVRDNGIGIDPQFFDRLFIIFQRLHSKEQYPGTGIGLAVCKKIVERHGGRIWVESQPGKGAIFFFTIPNRGGVAQ